MIRYHTTSSNIHSSILKRSFFLNGMKRFNCSTLYQFKTNNNEFYIADKPNEHYQATRPSYKGKTFSLQDQLPSLPVPDLNDTLNKYLVSIKPFIQSLPNNNNNNNNNNNSYNKSKSMSNDITDNKEYQKQVQLCDDFRNNLGPILQKRLQDHSSNRRNWMSSWWDSQAYLNYNDPVIPYVSYFYNHAPLSSLTHSVIENNPLFKATALVQSIVKFIELIKDEALPPELIKGTPFCMNSFHLMFNGARIPNTNTNANKDTDTSVFYSIFENNFIVVAYKGNFYKMVTHNTLDGRPLPVNLIYKQINDIVHPVRTDNNITNTQNDSGVGVLTSLPRDQWRSQYLELIKDPLSKSSLETIHRASFMLCLDLDKSPVTLEEKSRNSWHGNGINRFFDKYLQFFVTGNGKSGFLGEHSKMDGTPTLFLNTFICQDLMKLNQSEFLNDISKPIGLDNSEVSSFSSSSTSYQPKLLKFTLSPTIKNSITDAKAKFDSLMAEHDLNVWKYQKYGKNFIKQFKMSPDSYIQQIIQLAMYKYLGKQFPTYEAASTRKYFKGRTETGRSVTQESHEFVSNWSNPKLSLNEKIKLLQNAISAHSNYLKSAANGHGIDRHFFGLKNVLTINDQRPALFDDPLFNYSSTWYISTSQLSSEYFDGYGWSQVNDAGVGLAYMVNKDWLNINIVTKPGKSGLDGKRIRYYLTEAADEMANALIEYEKLNAKAKL
ncbi:carnitine O-acetyltransferase CAT2 PWA37_002894 [Arxiozyma heterogenica]|uniref:carnitine O-acetyltransferase CAT2 n=1 Tax=Arxiozyma heterogenica TaxID=278026 RepID=UPI002F0C0DFF